MYYVHHKLVIALIAILPVFAGAATSSSTTGVSFSKKQFYKEVSQIKKIARRKLASTSHVEESQALSKEFRHIRDSFIGNAKIPKPKTAEDIQARLVQLEKKLPQLKKSDAKVLAAQLLVFKSFRGFIHRSKKIFEKEDTKFYEIGRGKARIAHTMAVMALRAIGAGLDTYLVSPEWDALFEYTVKPQIVLRECKASWSANCQINDGATIQQWALYELLPRLVTLRDEVKKLYDSQSHMYWDNKLIFSLGEFSHTKDRFVKLGPAEQLLMLSFLSGNISAILGNSAFHMTGLFESMDSVAKLYGFNSTFLAAHATSKSRWQAIKKEKDLFKYKGTRVAADNLKESYNHLKVSMQYAYLAWNYLKEANRRGVDNGFLVNPVLVNPFQRILQTSFNNSLNLVGITAPNLALPLNQNIEEVANGEVQSAIFQGEKVTVNLKAFFYDPPASLQDFMPTQFKTGSPMYTTEIQGNTYKYRNYHLGNPNGWNHKVFNKYFGNVNNNNDVRRVARVLAQSWGGWILGLPISLAMF